MANFAYLLCILGCFYVIFGVPLIDKIYQSLKNTTMGVILPSTYLFLFRREAVFPCNCALLPNKKEVLQ
jgi:hypothetical protein